MSYHPIANHIYNLLIEDKITEQEGEISFDFLQMPIKINRKDGIGNLFEEWLSGWMNKKGIYFTTKSQKFPDFLLEEYSKTKGLLEVKTFSDSPAFDVGNFKAYCHGLTTEAYILDADYLIFEYQLKNSKFKIENIWLKKIWEITGKSKDGTITHQKRGNKNDKNEKPEDKRIVNIRPSSTSNWDSQTKDFKSRLDFVETLYDTLMQYYETKNNSVNWLQTVKNNYLYHTGNEL